MRTTNRLMILIMLSVECNTSCTNQQTNNKESKGAVVNADSMGASPWEHLWQFQADGYVESNLVLADNQVIFVTEDFNSSEFAINSVNMNSGELTWKYKAQRKIFWDESLTDTSLIFGDATETIYCINWKTGKEKYKIKTPYTNITAPMIFGNPSNSIAVFTANATESRGAADWKLNKLFAIQLPSGDLVWEGAPGLNKAIPLRMNGENYILYCSDRSGTDSLYLIECTMGRMGKEIWDVSCPCHPVSFPTIENDMIYMGCKDGSLCFVTTKGNVGKIRPADFQYPATTPIIISSSNEIQIIYGTGYNYLSFSQSLSGDKIKWTFDLKPESSKYRTMGQAVAKPLVSDSIVFVGSAGELYALNRETGKVLWDYPLGPHCLIYSPVVTNNPRKLLFADDAKTLSAISF